MKNLLITACLCLLSLVSFSQTNYYESNWKEVDQLLQKQKSKDAEKLIKEILSFAKKNNNKEQIIKSVAKMRMAQTDRDEKNEVNNIIAFEKVLPGLEFPEKNVVHSMIATLYQSYYQNHRWQIMKRTNVANTKDLKYPTDVETWTPQIYFDKIQEHYEASLNKASKLTQYKSEQFKELITAGQFTEKLRPTLFDVLVHRAIDFYSSYETDIAKPAYFFQLKNKNAFADITTFANTSFKNKDDYSSKYLALKYLQLASNMHKNDNEPSALIDLDVKRLDYAKQQYSGNDGDKLYAKALETLIKKYPNNITNAKPLLKLTQHIMIKDRVKAMQLCNELIKKYPKSIEYATAVNLKNSIEKESLNLTTENADLPNKNILGKVTYKNIDKIYFKIIDIGYSDYKKRLTNYKANKKIPTTGNVIEEWTLDVSKKAASKLYDAHTTELKINGLATGHYAIMASGHASFNPKRSPVSFTLFHATDISFVQSAQKNKSVIYVLNRDSGKPISSATVNRYQVKYDYNKRRNIITKVDTKTTDPLGLIVYDNKNNSNNRYQIEIIHNNDTYWSQQGFRLQRNYTARKREKIYLFTDRAIYRPGQNIFFKGIYIQSKGDNKEHSVLSNKKVDVIFKDANYKEVKKLTLTTNEFGSFNGIFKAPEGLLNGRFTIYTNKGSKQIKVEEYKRPKFEVVMDSLTNNVRLGDEVTVTGKAKAYAGNAIDGAKVKYTVRRTVRYPYRWCWWYYGGGVSQSQEIVLTTGEAKTDKHGQFKVSFTALGDEKVNPRTKPFYDFIVNADVTDINGETRTGNKHYTITEQSLIVSINAPSESDFNKFNRIEVSTTNISGKFTPSTVELALYQLEQPKTFLKKRFWQAPKENLLTETTFKKYFPDYEYDKESNPLAWKNKKTIWRKVVTTEQGKPIFLPKIAPTDGYYLIEAITKDSKGKENIEKKIIRLVNTAQLKAQNNEALFTYLSKSNLQPKDKTTLSISSAFKNAYIHQSIERQGETSNAWNSKKESFTINEKDRGGFYAVYFTIKNNRYYAKNVNIAVPWTNKELDISFETFRNKILPGSEQEWKVKISGKQKEKFSAELLATMYDASLDAFAKNNWSKLSLYGNTRKYTNWTSTAFSNATAQTLFTKKIKILRQEYQRYPQLNMFGLSYGGRNYALQEIAISADAVMESRSYNSAPPAPKRRMMKSKAAPASIGGERESGTAYLIDGIQVPEEQNENTLNNQEKATTIDESNISVRTDMSATAYFMPALQTDAQGNIIFSFKAPEALTRWNIKALAHTKDLKTGYAEKTLQTQKDLIITPNHPRFMREGDVMVYSAKISNLSDKAMNGNAKLVLLNAKTEEPVNELFKNNQQIKSFTAAQGQSAEVNWNITIPEAYTQPILVKIIAQAGNFSDGEQVSMPLLLNSMLVTETLPLPVRANTTKTFSFDKLKNSGRSNTLKHHKLTLEYTSNPAWYAVQALPYLTDYPYECSEQTFNRYYANALAAHIANSSPKIKQIFSQWKDKDTNALLSNLEKNQELKSALLQETPWVLDAENETEQKKKLAHLFNMTRMSNELNTAITKLEKLQTSNGGFAWFKGMRDNRYITQYIVTGIARLQKLGVSDAKNNKRIQSILNKAIPYLDARLREDYARIIKNGRLKLNNLSYYEIQYLYMRSFFPNKEMNPGTKMAANYFLKKGTKHWTSYNKYMQGMLAIVMNRNNESTIANDIMEALRQNAIHKEEMGMYWKEFNQSSYWWYQAPIEAHSLLIEAFNEMSGPELPKGQLNEVDEMRIWLLKQKQTQQWRTTKATADACYALLLGGQDWLSAEPKVEIDLGKKHLNLKEYKQEAGTGYTKINIDQQDIKAEMGNIKVKVTSDKSVGTTWGAVYWQYFEKLDKITEAETPLSLKKQVYKVVNGARGEELVLVKDNAQLKVGDKVKIRIELRVDRRIEYVHMKDMRGACFEPTNVLSNYKYQNGLGYYESTKDASTQFFFDNLNPGTYVFEYPMFATLKGNYSNGVTTIQCMYAPEFSSHSEGIRVEVK